MHRISGPPTSGRLAPTDQRLRLALAGGYESELMEAIRRGCVRLGVLSLISLLLSLLVLTLLVEAPAVLRWFAASAALCFLSFGAAVLIAYLQERGGDRA